MKKAYKIRENQKDIFIHEPYVQKGQKITAAIYLLTEHFKDDPLAKRLRELAVEFSSHEPTLTRAPYAIEGGSDNGKEIITLMGSAKIAGLVSEKNFEIIKSEIGFYRGMRLAELKSSEEYPIGEDFFITPAIKDILNQKDISKRHIKDIYKNKKAKNNQIKSIKIEKRQKDIISLINEKKQITIKDIMTFFPTIGGKTILRELNNLLAEGRIKRQGNKRWSMYIPADF